MLREHPVEEREPVGEVALGDDERRRQQEEVAAHRERDALADGVLHEELERNNFVGVAIDYRLSGHAADGSPVNPFPAAVDDVKTAVRFLKANAGRYDLRGSQIILAGVSAGGHLAALAGTSAAVGLLEPQQLPPGLGSYDSRVRAVIDVVGISDVKAWGAIAK